MLNNNDKLEYCNIDTWQSAGYTGKGVAVAVLENFSGHGGNVADIIRQVAPGAEVLERPGPSIAKQDGKLSPASRANLEAFYRSLVAEGVRLINMSLGGSDLDDLLQLQKDILHGGGVTLVTSAGNKGEKGLGKAASTDVWISVGACTLVNGQPKPTTYSSVGEALDICGFSNLYLTRGNYVQGTSFSSPWVAGMLALWFERHFELYGRYPTHQESLQFMIANAEDMGDVGHDPETGHGLFILPKEVGEIDTALFINLVKPGALKGYSDYNILPSVTIAQAALESAWGESHIQNNLFGIKWTKGCGFDKVTRQTKEYVGGKYVTVTAYFRGYKNFSESIIDHAKLLTLDRYAAVRQAVDYQEAARALQAAGYATDPAYANKLISIVKQYNLSKIDQEAISMDTKGHWAEADINKAVAKGLLKGYPDGSLKPDNAVTRAELVVILDRLGLLS